MSDMIIQLDMNYDNAEEQKEQFRKYLESTGVVSQLTRVLVSLYEDANPPANAIDYIKKYLGAPIGIDIDELRNENAELRQVNEELQRRCKELTEELERIRVEEEN